jgi:N-acylneuraminate cytidylyltransferase
VKIAVIPARGGSKRIPGKNIRNFAGKPIIAWSIEGALRSGVFDRVLVSTDDEAIARVARAHGAEVPFTRPPELSDDFTGLGAVMAHVVRLLQSEGAQPDAVCCIYSTAPFLRAEDLARGLQVLESGSWNYVLSATSFASPIFRAFRKRADGGLEMFYPEHYSTRSQDLPEALHDAGHFCWGRPQAWLDSLSDIDGNSTMVPIPRWLVQDIDTPEDWRRAELMHAALAAEGPR